MAGKERSSNDPDPRFRVLEIHYYAYLVNCKHLTSHRCYKSQLHSFSRCRDTPRSQIKVILRFKDLAYIAIATGADATAFIATRFEVEILSKKSLKSLLVASSTLTAGMEVLTTDLYLLVAAPGARVSLSFLLHCIRSWSLRTFQQSSRA